MKKRRTKEARQLSSQSEPNVINYDAAVAEAKQIVATMETSRMRLGELAAHVETQYGEETLKQFAKDTGIARCTFERSRSVWKAWADISAAPPKSYSVAMELQAHPDRAEIIRANPDISTREARKLARKYRQEDKPKANGKWKLKETKKWFQDLVTRASEAIEDLTWAKGQVDDPGAAPNHAGHYRAEPAGHSAKGW